MQLYRTCHLCLGSPSVLPQAGPLEGPGRAGSPPLTWAAVLEWLLSVCTWGFSS